MKNEPENANFQHFCPNCNSILENQPDFDSDKDWWECRECGDMLFGDGIYSGERFPNVMWFCDDCDELLNAQAGFTDQVDGWICEKCGYVNMISKAALR